VAQRRTPRLDGREADEDTAAADPIVANGIPAEPAGRHGWTYEVTQPLETLLAVRDTGQLSHSDIDVDILQREVYPGPRVRSRRASSNFRRRLPLTATMRRRRCRGI